MGAYDLEASDDDAPALTRDMDMLFRHLHDLVRLRGGGARKLEEFLDPLIERTIKLQMARIDAIFEYEGLSEFLDGDDEPIDLKALAKEYADNRIMLVAVNRNGDPLDLLRKGELAILYDVTHKEMVR